MSNSVRYEAQKLQTHWKKTRLSRYCLQNYLARHPLWRNSLLISWVSGSAWDRCCCLWMRRRNTEFVILPSLSSYPTFSHLRESNITTMQSILFLLLSKTIYYEIHVVMLIYFIRFRLKITWVHFKPILCVVTQIENR